jgi:outer membrane lipoprotein-sorting protein
MVQWCKKYISLAGLLALLVLLAACSVPALGSSSSSPAQTLQNSAAALAKLNSVHAELQTSVAAQATNGRNGVTFSLTGHGDARRPADASISLSLGKDHLLAVISKGSIVYVQGRNHLWYWLDKHALKDAAQNFFSQSLATRLGQIETVVEQARLTDHGQESLNGVSLDHISAVLDQQTLQTLNTQLSGLLPRGVQTGQSQITAASLDLWIDQSTWYVHQAILNVGTQIDMSALQSSPGHTSATGVVPVTIKAQVNLSRFNEPVNIQAPTGALPFPQ